VSSHQEMLAKLRMLGESLGAIERSPMGYQRRTRILEACHDDRRLPFWDLTRLQHVNTEYHDGTDWFHLKWVGPMKKNEQWQCS